MQKSNQDALTQLLIWFDRIYELGKLVETLIGQFSFANSHLPTLIFLTGNGTRNYLASDQGQGTERDLIIPPVKSATLHCEFFYGINCFGIALPSKFKQTRRRRLC